ncbi:hypothetical protein [Pareuzebyella sediminis]|uniref:hypothetical protein n=1 Tax=Pareuzebyella sediminis TaxID=2607998 RepID=UPI0011ED490E|nr:hypothetical protein [Pareuzebyella sediminis]
MRKNILRLSAVMAFFIANGVFANNPKTEKDISIINSVEFIEEDDTEFDLGFDTADYLPEGFDPYKIFVDLSAIDFIEVETKLTFDSTVNLPKGFDPYSFPTEVEAFNFIDENDTCELDFNTKDFLPEGFDPFIRH